MRPAQVPSTFTQFGDGPEIGYIKDLYRSHFTEAARAAFAALSSYERTVLRMWVLDGLDIDAIGIALRTPRSTVHRHLMQARQWVLDATRQRLRERLRLTPSQADSLIGFLQSRIDLKVSELLHTGEAE